jgi:hypothetical protein
MNKLVLAAVIPLCAFGAAHAQTTVTPQQRATAPLQRVQPTAPPVSRVPITATQRATVPGNLFSVEDRAIIIVGGKPVAAGAVKQQIQSELRQASTPASARFIRTRPQAVPVRDLPGHVRPALTDRVNATQLPPRVGGPLNGRNVAVQRPAQSYADLVNYCKTHPAEITRVRGVVTPNNRFTIDGVCFGTQAGNVEAIGQFPGGKMRLAFESWNDSQIVAFMPAVSGAADHSMAVTVQRADQARSPAAQAQFIAARQQVPVPPGFWSQNPNFVAIEVAEGGGDIFQGYLVFGAGSPQRSTPFTVRVNPACALDSAAWSSRTGRVDAFNGWDNPGPPNIANVDVVWTPRCVTQTTNYIFASSSQRVCSVEFALSATASCPVGLAP